MTGKGLKELFRQAGLPQPIIMGAPYATKSTRSYNIAAAEEITQLRIPMAKGADIFLTGERARAKEKAARCNDRHASNPLAMQDRHRHSQCNSKYPRPPKRWKNTKKS